MLGYVLTLPVEAVAKAIDRRVRKTYGEAAGLTPETAHALSLAVLDGALSQTGGHSIRLKHVLVDMTAAA